MYLKSTSGWWWIWQATDFCKFAVCGFLVRLNYEWWEGHNHNVHCRSLRPFTSKNHQHCCCSLTEREQSRPVMANRRQSGCLEIDVQLHCCTFSVIKSLNGLSLDCLVGLSDSWGLGVTRGNVFRKNERKYTIRAFKADIWSCSLLCWFLGSVL